MDIPTVVSAMLVRAAPDLAKQRGDQCSAEHGAWSDLFSIIRINYVDGQFDGTFLLKRHDRAEKY
ncbi:MAG: hypothetical protein WBB60_16330 [Nitrospira sp.]|nr:hypothetical protein [Nitrospira sp.]HQY58234.1 hypothetical protein [Nitrospira sp.]